MVPPKSMVVMLQGKKKKTRAGNGHRVNECGMGKNICCTGGAVITSVIITITIINNGRKEL